MTYTIRLRSLPGSPMLADYDCPSCGPFEAIVTRDAQGDPPELLPCPAVDDEDACAEPSPRVITAAKIRYWSTPPVPIGYASKGDVPDPRALDTTDLATGKLTRAQWDKKQRAITHERRYQKRLKAGQISKKIQVGGG